MEFINFKSAKEIEKSRNELREARNAMLEKAKQDAENRIKRSEKARERGEGTWMLPELLEKIEKSSSKPSKHKSKKSKKEKKKKHRKEKQRGSSSESDSEEVSDENDMEKLRSKKNKHKKERHRKSSSDESDAEDDRSKKKNSKKKKRKAKKNINRSSSDDSDSETETNNKTINKDNETSVGKNGDAKNEKAATNASRDEWMTLSAGTSLCTFTKSDLRKERDLAALEKNKADIYAPGKSARELNPYWRDGGDGLPSSNTNTPATTSISSSKLNFCKPDDDRRQDTRKSTNDYSSQSSRGNWRKKTTDSTHQHNRDESNVKHTHDGGDKKNTVTDNSTGSSSASASDDDEQDVKARADAESNKRVFLTDEQMNELAAKLVKAEILGNTAAIEELKRKLDEAREYRKQQRSSVQTKDGSGNSNSNMNIVQEVEEEDSAVVLTTTDARGVTRPLAEPKGGDRNDPYYGRHRKKRNKKVDKTTHSDGKRTKYFADDDRHTLRDMFENERLGTANDAQDRQFAEIVARHTNPNDELEDVFSESVSKNVDDQLSDDKARTRAIRDHERMRETLESCDRCLDSKRTEKHLIVAMGEHCYVCVPRTEGLQRGHCRIVPMKHASCSTLLDEEVWREMQDFRRALTRMFRSRGGGGGSDTVYYECALHLERRPHMAIECVPICGADVAEMLPFCFKKAIQECEGEWSHNRKLIELKGKELTRAVPKGLPYFWVDFGDGTGFAHVVEEQDRFPRHFAEEIIGGVLELEPRMWRHPKKLSQPIQRVMELAEWWKLFDITKKS